MEKKCSNINCGFKTVLNKYYKEYTCSCSKVIKFTDSDNYWKMLYGETKRKDT
jgi:hypothetical protein